MSDHPRRILAIETSGRMGSAVLGTEDGVMALARLSGEMKHAAELLPAIGHMLEAQGWPADGITDVFVSIGPGSFTGLRIGVTLARTLGWSIEARIVAVPTVDCIARNALAARPQHLAVILDAKRSQVYAAAFRLVDDQCVKIVDACLDDPYDFLARCPKPVSVLGEGVPYHGEAITRSGAAVLDRTLWSPRSERVWEIGLQMARAGQFTPHGDLVPLYIRRPDAEEKWEKLHPVPVKPQ